MDVLAWCARTRTLLIVEVKSWIVDIQDLLGALDRKRRVAHRLAAEHGWEPEQVGVWLAVRDSRTNRRRLAEHRATLGAALPADGRALDRWLRQPIGRLDALSFLPDLHPETGNRTTATCRRVRARPSSTGQART